MATQFSGSLNIVGSLVISGSLITTQVSDLTASRALTSSYADSLNSSGNYVLNILTASNLLVTDTLYATNYSASNIYITSSHLL